LTAKLLEKEPTPVSWLVAVGLLWLACRALLFFDGVLSPDSFAYAHHAYNIATGQFSPTADHLFYGYRFGVLLPVALAYRLFGVSSLSSALPLLLASLVTLWLVYRLGTMLLDHRTGLLAAALYTFFPLDLPWATLIGPDSFLPLCSALAFLFLIQALDSARPMSRWLFCLSSGLCAGVAFQVRESGTVLLAALLVALVVEGRHRQPRGITAGLVAIVAGFAVPLLLQMLYYAVAVGDPWIRLTVLGELRQGHNAPDRGWPTSLSYYPLAMLGLDLGGLAWYGFFFYVAAFGIGWALVKKEVRRLRLLLIWAGVVFALLEFGPLSIRPYIPVVKTYHYLSLMSVPVLLVGAYGVMAAVGRVPDRMLAVGFSLRRLALVGSVLFLAGSSLYGAYRVYLNFQDDARPYQVVASAVSRHPDRPVYVPHERWALFLNYYLGYRTGFNFYGDAVANGRSRIRYVWDVRDPVSLRGAYVVAHDRYLYYEFFGNPIERDPRIPAFVYEPPPGWRVLIRHAGTPRYNSLTLYEVG
jgi:4-amino-4-deoxy-L-arabinose transferase-like glycosyltransferase